MIHFIAVPNGSRQINYCFKFTFELKMPFLLIADYYKANFRLCDPIGWHSFASKCVRTIANDFLASLSHCMSFYLELLKLSLLSREWMEINKFCFCIEWTVRCLSKHVFKLIKRFVVAQQYCYQSNVVGSQHIRWITMRNDNKKKNINFSHSFSSITDFTSTKLLWKNSLSAKQL